MFFKPATLWLKIRLADGSEKRFRFIAGMGETAFLLSPLIETTDEFALLYTDQAKVLEKNAVVLLSLHSEGFLGNWQWRNTYDLLLN